MRSGSGPNPLMDPPAGPACVDLAMMVMVRKRIVTVVSELTDEERWNGGVFSVHTESARESIALPDLLKRGVKREREA